MKILVIALLLASIGIFSVAETTDGNIFNWEFGDFDSSNLTVVENKVIEKNILKLILKDYLENPVVIKIKTANIEQKMENITFRKELESKNKTQKFYVFAVDGSSYYVVYTISDGEILDKYMLSSWRL